MPRGATTRLPIPVIGLNSGSGGASSIVNMGTWNDTNTFATRIKSGYPGPSDFHNIGTYNKQGHATTIIGATYENTGTTNVNAGKLLLGGGGSSTGSFNIAANSTLEFTAGNAGRIVGVNDTTWGGSTTPDLNRILFNSEFSIQSLSSWIVNSGTWNDTNSFNSAIGVVNAAFHNNGTYNKLGNALTVMAADYSNTGTTDVNAGKMAVAHSFSNSGEIVVSVGAAFQVVHVRTVWAGG
jgi:hypothetical protein